MSLWDGDGKWYPCRVLGLAPHVQAVTDNTDLPTIQRGHVHVRVRFLTYGNEQVVPYKSLRQVTAASWPDINTALNEEAFFPIRVGLKGQSYCAQVKQLQTGGNFDDEVEDDPEGITDKYFDQRYRLFSRYDDGIQLDKEGWFSTTPEVIAQHTADRFSRLPNLCPEGGHGDIILDAFVGCGGNAVHLARVCRSVCCIDIDAAKLSALQNNARVYGVADSIHVHQGDFFHVADQLVRDMSWEPAALQAKIRPVDEEEQQEEDLLGRLFPSTVFSTSSLLSASSSLPSEAVKRHCSTSSSSLEIRGLLLSPPWGGVDYSGRKCYDLEKDLFAAGVRGGRALLRMALRLSANVCLLLPRNTPDSEIARTVHSLNTSCVVENVHIYNKAKMKVVYIGAAFVAQFAHEGESGLRHTSSAPQPITFVPLRSEEDGENDKRETKTLSLSGREEYE